jgi:hypothetical protein
VSKIGEIDPYPLVEGYSYVNLVVVTTVGNETSLDAPTRGSTAARIDNGVSWWWAGPAR